MAKILCVGNQWRGANDGALFKAFSRLGHFISIVDHMYFIPSFSSSFIAKLSNKLIKPVNVREYNNHLKKQTLLFKPDLVIVYKGTFVQAETLQWIHNQGITTVNVFPDVSMFAHGKNIPESMPIYDWIFTTKSFGLNDIKTAFHRESVSYLPHGFDPEIHRPLNISASMFPNLLADVSFIGTFSKKKEQILSTLAESCSESVIKIWGSHWEKTEQHNLIALRQQQTLLGDAYAAGIILSKINLGILSEQVSGASAGDQITSRTFHIPATGGFMIHEKTDELLQYFEDNKNIVTYSDAQDLAEKVKYYLKHEDERLNIAAISKEHVWKNHKIDNRAQFILDTLKQKNLIG